VKIEKNFDRGNGCGGMDFRAHDDGDHEIALDTGVCPGDQASYFMTPAQARTLRDALTEALGEGSRT
jgi:hypothetical protein